MTVEPSVSITRSEVRSSPARRTHAAVNEHVGKSSRVTARPTSSAPRHDVGPHPLEQGRLVGYRHDEAVAVLPGHRLRLGAEAAHVDRYAVLDVDVAEVGHVERDARRLAPRGEVGLPAVEQVPADAYVVLEGA